MDVYFTILVAPQNQKNLLQSMPALQPCEYQHQSHWMCVYPKSSSALDPYSLHAMSQSPSRIYHSTRRSKPPGELSTQPPNHPSPGVTQHAFTVQYTTRPQPIPTSKNPQCPLTKAFQYLSRTLLFTTIYHSLDSKYLLRLYNVLCDKKNNFHAGNYSILRL